MAAMCLQKSGVDVSSKDGPRVSAAIERSLQSLDDRERRLILFRYFDEGAPRTIEEASHILGLTVAEVEVIEEIALSKMGQQAPQDQ